MKNDSYQSLLKKCATEATLNIRKTPVILG